MPYSLRDAVSADLAAIAEIYCEAVRNHTASFELDPPDVEEMTKRHGAITRGGYPYIVAIDDKTGALLGYAYASSYRARPAYRWTVENSVYIDPMAQGRGIGKALTQEIIDRCEQADFRQMIAVIGGEDNIGSIKMHESLGFDHVGVLPGTGFKHGKWLSSVLMQKPLGKGVATDPDMDAFPGNQVDQSD